MAPKPSRRSQLASNCSGFPDHPSNRRQAPPGPPPQRHGSPIDPSPSSPSPPPRRAVPAGRTRSPSPDYGPAHEAMRRAMLGSRATPAINLIGAGVYLDQAFPEPAPIIRPVWFGETGSGVEEMAASSYPFPRATTIHGMPTYPPLLLEENEDNDDVESGALSPSPPAGAPPVRLPPGFDITQNPSYFRGPVDPSGFVAVNVTVNAGNVPTNGTASTEANSHNAAASGGMTFALDPSALLGSANTSGEMPSTWPSAPEASSQRMEDTSAPDLRPFSGGTRPAASLGGMPSDFPSRLEANLLESTRSVTNSGGQISRPASKRRRIGNEGGTEEPEMGGSPGLMRMSGQPDGRADSPIVESGLGDDAEPRKGRKRAKREDGRGQDGDEDGIEDLGEDGEG
ncbi:hypothetical protein TI39_contig491g00008 [Zymoseptoria brevis]|uniref:Uncharacterized protein n=1 Tax=Zymoseptoria brevis TaxID=1047168 RepID=A0A0F4GJ48_9PEZI|nr:hypothetical protein TI39_contig491g00008 [Zymoseptoria brevis]